MKIAIIGGGASGMICAYLLDKAGHEVTVLEKQDKLGGNIRTTNKNVQVKGLAKDLFLEGGVVEFSAAFKRFHLLMEELGIVLKPIPIGTALFLKDGKHYLSIIMNEKNRTGWRRLWASWRYYALQLSLLNAGRRAKQATATDLRHQSMQEFFNKENHATTWAKNCTMYSYSIPFEDIAAFPAELGIPSIRDYMGASWFRIEGGVYLYIEKILARFKGEIICNAVVNAVRRGEKQVQIQWNEEAEQCFDKVIFATPPDQVLQLLSDPTSAEQKRFAAWKANHAQTIIHTDDHFYQRYNIQHPSPFDFFETSNGWAYNAYLNDLCQTPSDASYFLSFNMESLIKPTKIIHRQDHHTPFYTVEAFRHREEVIATNGENNTYHVGAYLADGLHEGAVVSAERVRDLLEG